MTAHSAVDVADDEPVQPMEVALGLQGLFESKGHKHKTRCICGRAECPSSCSASAVMVTDIHLDNSMDHVVARGNGPHGEGDFAWKAHIDDFHPVATDGGLALLAPGQPILELSL